MNLKQTPAPAFAILALMLLAGCREDRQRDGKIVDRAFFSHVGGG